MVTWANVPVVLIVSRELAAAPAPLAITLRIFLDTGVRLGEATGLCLSGALTV